MEQTERITKYEKLLDEARAAADELAEAIERYSAAQPGIRDLDLYYGSDEWLKDLEDDEKGLLAADLKRGVLSEDAVYDLITDNRELAALMLDTAARFIRGI